VINFDAAKMTTPNIEDLESKDIDTSTPPTLLREPQDRELTEAPDRLSEGSRWKDLASRVGVLLKEKGVEDRGIIPRPEDVGVVNLPAVRS